MPSYSYLCKKAGLPVPRGEPIQARKRPLKSHGVVPRSARKAKYQPLIYALFFMPEIHGTGDKAETRLIKINGLWEQDWIDAMSKNYAALGYGLTTFFPNHA
jgi:hypothetical protein